MHTRRTFLAGGALFAGGCATARDREDKAGGRIASIEARIARPPRRAPIAIANYTSESNASGEDKSAAHADVAQVIVEAWG